MRIETIVSRYNLTDYEQCSDRTVSLEDKILDTLLQGLPEHQRAEFLQPKVSDMPSPVLMKNIDAAAALLLRCIQEKQQIMIIGDYDADGITATMLMLRFLRATGHSRTSYRIPSRFESGYGLKGALLKEVLACKPDLVITVDNGITSKVEIDQLQAESIEVLVIDHHEEQEGHKPGCLILNPKQQGCGYPYKKLAAVGVVFIFLVQLRSHLRSLGFWRGTTEEPPLTDDLDLVAIGTLADKMVLDGLNRAMVRRGFSILQHIVDHREHTQEKHLYFRAFTERNIISDICAEVLNFRFIPLLNAAGRVETAEKSVEFLNTSDLEAAHVALTELLALNRKRKEISDRLMITAQSKAKLQSAQGGICVYDDSFHEGVLGILAGKLCNDYQLPTIVFSRSEHEGQVCWKGSGRSIERLNLLDILESLSEYTLSFGGHACAAGVQVSQDQLEGFCAAFLQHCSQMNPDAQPTGTGVGDIEVTDRMLNLSLYKKLSHMEPYGQGNPKPLFVLRNVNLDNGTLIGGKHLKWRKYHDLEIICWNSSYFNFSQNNWDLLVDIQLNEHHGIKRLQAVVRNLAATNTTG